MLERLNSIANNQESNEQSSIKMDKSMKEEEKRHISNKANSKE
jgi:hypothetical protein